MLIIAGWIRSEPALACSMHAVTTAAGERAMMAGMPGNLFEIDLALFSSISLWLMQMDMQMRTG